MIQGFISLVRPLLAIRTNNQKSDITQNLTLEIACVALAALYIRRTLAEIYSIQSGI